MSQALPCIRCGKELKNVFEDAENQPSDGTAFITYGHYGSTVFDPMDSSSCLELNVCDECLRELGQLGHVKQVVSSTKVTHTYYPWTDQCLSAS